MEQHWSTHGWTLGTGKAENEKVSEVPTFWQRAHKIVGAVHTKVKAQILVQEQGWTKSGPILLCVSPPFWPSKPTRMWFAVKSLFEDVIRFSAIRSRVRG